MELVIVVGIVMTLAALATPSFLQAVTSAKYARAAGDINALQSDILTYSSTNGTLPKTLADVGRGGFLDPWGMPYIYTNYALPGAKGLRRKDHFLQPLNSDFDLFSSGPDKKWKPPIASKTSKDDVIRANDGAYIGRASEY